MAYLWGLKRRSDLFTGEKNVTAVAWNAAVGAWQITLSADETNVALGKLFEIRSSTTAANNGCWTIIWQHATTPQRVFCVAEVLTAQGASGTGVASENGAIKQAAVAVTSFVDAQTIQCPGALFETNQVRRGDRVGVYGSTGAVLNRASYYVLAVLSETTLTVCSRALAANPLTPGAGAGATLVVYPGYGQLWVINEASPTWAAVQATFPPLVTSETIGAGQSGSITHHRIAAIRDIWLIHTVAFATEWISEDELVTQHRTDTTPVIFKHFEFGVSLGSTIRLGRAGSDDQGFSRGSTWIGVGSNVAADLATARKLLKMACYGSLLRGVSLDLAANGILVGCSLVDCAVSSTDVGTIRSTLEQGVVQATPPFVLGSTTVIESLVIGSSSFYSFVAFGSATISDVLLSDDCYFPRWYLLGVPMLSFRDPQEDYLAAELVGYSDGSSLASVDYSWRPRFVRLDPTGGVPIPVAGLVVRAYQQYEGNPGSEWEVAGSPWTTDAQGRINGGVAVPLLARTDVYDGSRTQDVEVMTRLTVEGPRLRYVNQILKMRASLDYDVRVQLLETDFEGEVST